MSVWIERLQYPLNLHCSQTTSTRLLMSQLLQYPLNLHCSQTGSVSSSMLICFNTLWIYTALKLFYHSYKIVDASIPPEFTLLSNAPLEKCLQSLASIPSEFTLLSNGYFVNTQPGLLQYPLNLHCSQTESELCRFRLSFNTLWIYTALKPVAHELRHLWASIPSEFTLLSNEFPKQIKIDRLQYPLNLHCSQTNDTYRPSTLAFNTPWIYTAGKRV